MTDLNPCPSCRGPLDHPSGDGCANMTAHKERAMSDEKCCGACGYPIYATKESACDWCRRAADRIEALTKERDQWISHAKTAIWSDSEELKETERRLAKAVKLIDLAVELARWDRAPKLRDDMIDFTTEIKGESHE